MLAGSASGANRGTAARKSRSLEAARGGDGAREETHAQRAPGDEADAQFLAERQDLRLRTAPQHRVLVLDHRHRVYSMRAADRLQPRLGQAVMKHLALGNQVFHRPGHVLDGHLRVDAMLVEQVDAVGSQAPQLGLDHLPNVFGPAVPPSASLARLRIDVEAELGGYDDPIADALQRLADDFLGHEGAIGLGGVEQRDAQIRGPSDEGDG